MEEYTNHLVHHGVKGMKWGVRKQFQAAHRFRKSNKSNAIRVSKQYGDRIRGLEKRHEIEGEKIGDWGSTQGRKLMDRQYDEMKALKEEGRKAVNKAALLDAGYTEEQAEVGFKWMPDQEKKGSKYVMYKIKHSNEDDTFLVHHGVKGQKWGVRRYQNADGTLTNAGKKRYDSEMKDLKKYTESSAEFWREQRKLDPLVSEAKRVNKKIIVPKDQLQKYENAYKKWEQQHDVLSKKYKNVTENKKVMDDGYEYVVGKLRDDSLGELQYFSVIGPAKRKN